MNTPTHMLMGAVCFGRSGRAATTVAAMAGGVIPDLPAIVMVLFARYVQGVPMPTIFRDLYFSPSWQAVIGPTHSFLTWGALLAVAMVAGFVLLRIFALSGLLHCAIDFPLHHDDGHRQFWPLSDWRFQSPVSYWDPAHYGGIVAPLEMGLAVVLAVILFARHTSTPARIAFGAVLVLYAAQIVYFTIIFGG
ncbi:MAG: cobalamin biosynthesis protein CobQ [Pseudomonadota bacterium]